MKPDLQVLMKIFELKGLIESLAELANYDEQYNYPMIEKMENKINEITESLENDV